MVVFIQILTRVMTEWSLTHRYNVSEHTCSMLRPKVSMKKTFST